MGVVLGNGRGRGWARRFPDYLLLDCFTVRFPTFIAIAALGGLLSALPLVTPEAGAQAQALPNRPDVLDVTELKPGMKGYGLTVFEGTTPEKFDVEIIDVLKNFRPRQDLILIKTSTRASRSAQGRRGHERQPDLPQRQDDRRLRLRLDLRQGAGRRRHADPHHARRARAPAARKRSRLAAPARCRARRRKAARDRRRARAGARFLGQQARG